MADIQEFSKDSEWEELVNKSSVPVLVEFFTPWCEPCKELEPVLKKLSKEFPITFYRYNMDKLQYRANSLTVTGVPTMLLMLPKFASGEADIFDRIVGYMTVDMMRPKLEALIEKWKQRFGA